MDPALDDDSLHGFPQQLFWTVPDSKVGNLHPPLLAPPCDHMRVGVIKADQCKLAGVLDHLTDHSVRVGMPHPQHGQSEGHGSFLRLDISFETACVADYADVAYGIVATGKTHFPGGW
jgi:hypothetical protein